jgi:hypothetical protein
LIESDIFEIFKTGFDRFWEAVELGEEDIEEPQFFSLWEVG